MSTSIVLDMTLLFLIVLFFLRLGTKQRESSGRAHSSKDAWENGNEIKNANWIDESVLLPQDSSIEITKQT